MLDVGVLLLTVIAIVGWMVWCQPLTLRYLAARMWARAHAIEVMREAYSSTVARIEGQGGC